MSKPGFKVWLARLICWLAPWLAALWWGSLSALAAYVVPLLFIHLPSQALAGQMAAQLFSAQSWLGLLCGLLLLCASRFLSTLAAGSKMLPFVLLGMLLNLLLQWAVAPRIMLRHNLMLWHSAAVALYFLQWLCASWVLQQWLDAGRRHRS